MSEQTMPVPELTAENTEFLEFEDIVRCCAEKPDRFNWTPEELTVGRAIRSASCEAPTYPFHVFSGGEAEANIVMWCRYAARAAIKAVRELEQIMPVTRCEDCPPKDYPTDKTRCTLCDRREVSR